MKNRIMAMNARKVGLCAAALILGLVAAPAVRADGLHVGVNIPAPSVNVQVGAPDDYVYYPKYGTYYSPGHHRYYYQDHGAWGWREKPPGVAPDVFLKAPSVKMNFHDAPDKHHAEIARQYPKNWAPRHEEHPNR
ncbi:MAG TPA: hypothetical protein VGO67_02005 [Verrucomicrobiae bacterium]|jgi:hypothetical protein